MANEVPMYKEGDLQAKGMTLGLAHNWGARGYDVCPECVCYSASYADKKVESNGA